MSNQNCPRRRGQRPAASCPASVPLCTPQRPAETAQGCVPAAESAVLRAAAEEDIRMCRYVNPIPVPACSPRSEELCLLRRQTELLTEILAVLQAGSAPQA